MAAHAARPMVTYQALRLGATPVEIGVIQSAYSVLPMLTALAIGRSVDRIGASRITAVGATSIGVGAVVGAFSPDLGILLVAQLFMGLGLIMAAVSTQTAVAAGVAGSAQVQRFGWYAVAVSIGQLAGPIVAATLAISATAGSIPPAGIGDVDVVPALLFAAAAAGLAVVVTAVLADHRRPDRTATDGGWNLRAGAARVIGRSGMPAAMFVSITVTASIDVLLAYLPAYGAAAGLGVETVGALLAVRAAASLGARAFMGRLHAALGLGRLLFASTAIASVSLLVLPAVAAIPLLFVLMILIGLGLGVGQPLTVAWVAGRATPDDRGVALGVRLTGNFAATLIVPTLMGILAGASGLGAIWGALAALLAAGALVAWRTSFEGRADRSRDAVGDATAG
jgi:MFS family permease